MDAVLETYYADQNRENKEELQAQNQRISTWRKIYTEDQLKLHMITKQVENHKQEIQRLMNL